jgi:hypothetical protein
MIAEKVFVEVDYTQENKSGQTAAGDVFLSHKSKSGDRTVCVLADGLGSGIKANVLATLTATMAMKYITSDIDPQKAARIIMSTLPVCSTRKIGYSTFTIIDVQPRRRVRIIEYDNPAYLLISGGKEIKPEKQKFIIKTATTGERELFYSDFTAAVNDRIVFFSDGVTQSGMGRETMPLGWSSPCAADYALENCRKEPEISARQLTKRIVERALKNDLLKAKDDISCAVVSFREPRRTLIVTGPPFDKKNDAVLGKKFREYNGRKVICGGTTAGIIARETASKVEIDLSNLWPDIPPKSKMDGAELVTEGTLTLNKTLEILKSGKDPDKLRRDPASELAKIFMESDIINFIVGTKINEAHQDPTLPEALDIRRNLLKSMVQVLNEKYLKEANIELI